ncbi:F-box/LRR-repeat protein 25-like [Lycium ferocissimum]|uniref:F-box/LRR-repeat protein 25-like n=1 Tax=Lycium ferocissimum TaxID=112874 RepID=UPI002815661A|nr:F-box/LRR-repeat protein 25-like [Lycium ferocissimum]
MKNKRKIKLVERVDLQRNIKLVERLSNLPEPILLHILSLLPDGKQVVRMSVLSKRWRFLWMSVPVSLHFDFSTSHINHTPLHYLALQLHYWSSCEKIRQFSVSSFTCQERYAKHVDLWLHFATTKVEEFTLAPADIDDQILYDFPQFAFKSASFRKLVLNNLKLNPSGSVNWTSLTSLSIANMELTNGVMEKLLSGCPNLECLKLEEVWGIQRLEINSLKLRKLTIQEYEYKDFWFEILAPYVENLQVNCFCGEIRMQRRNVHSLVTAVLDISLHSGDECSYMKELLHSVAHVENLELSPSCIQVY